MADSQLALQGCLVCLTGGFCYSHLGMLVFSGGGGTRLLDFLGVLLSSVATFGSFNLRNLVVSVSWCLLYGSIHFCQPYLQ